MKLILSRDAIKGISIMPKRDGAALIEKLKRFAAAPFRRHTFAAPLVGALDRIRVRQGDWRAVILVSRAHDAVIVERIAHRREVYR